MECCTKGCRNKARARGLCLACYQAADRRIKAGETSWRSLVRLGLALPLKIKAKFSKSFARSK